ncbi:hypothetical protein AB0B50_17080 [Streptomyces sp. NPDC041068]|uniref:hypothetical protein n=1 Tax=Streptomyces sp. NPDC041068 TaxID=3155130 RepID=UPI0033E77056
MSNQFPPPHQNPPADPYANPQAGLPSYTGPAQDPAYAYGPMAPQKMPGVVRAAQIVLWVLGGLTFLGTVGLIFISNPETAGAALGVNLCVLVSAGMAFRYGTVGNGIRVTCIVLMSVQIAVALGGAASGNGAGLLPLLGAIAVVVLLSQGAAGAWFKRPRG